ncbi:HAMP domain-containing sensor histidine kinase [Nocardioides sp. R-C-SC26]|uniref:HAMP domain-containing sensor histidine kinase n=1 Tax=Nocardioides sp. R-C-SC26 TaxID=2870414 RepID=UPI001E2E9A07|nr:HAMP domain-containing sensor histidine kinase [Nocardioides sp. R-C-SC26]
MSTRPSDLDHSAAAGDPDDASRGAAATAPTWTPMGLTTASDHPDPAEQPGRDDGWDPERDPHPEDVIGTRWHYRRSLASRLLLLTTIAVGLSVAFVAVGAYVTARAQLSAQLDDSLRDRAAATAQAIATNQSESFIPLWLGPATDTRVFFLSAEANLGIYDRGAPLAVGTPEIDVATGKTEESLRTIRDATGEYRVIAFPIGDVGALIIAESLDQQHKVLTRLGFVSLAFGLIGVLGAGIAGWAVTRNGLRPVRRLTASVEEIAQTQDLTTALPIEGDDEVARLAAAFNQMLLALDASREHQRRLVADAGHELRTPLTSLRTNVDLLLQSDGAAAGAPSLDPQARRELLDDIAAQTDELTTLIGDLTELARDEPIAPVVGEVDLSEIVDVAVARVRRRAPETTFDVGCEHWYVVGEAPALERAVTNLLDNAAKWGPAGGTITVRLGGGVLTIDDDGPGIAPGERERVFDRFWRAEDARTMPGSGLGLSIVRQVAERHSGAVRADASPSGGARLQMLLPGRSDA